MSTVSGGIALISGASSGIGRAFALELVRMRARGLVRRQGVKPTRKGLPPFDEVWLVARREDRLKELETELAALDTGVTIKLFPLDLVSAGAVASLEQALRSQAPVLPQKPLSILVNNAGYGTYGPLLEVAVERQLGQIDLNCRALGEACARLGPYLIPGSLVINVASLAAFAPLAGFAVYAASKAFVLSLSCALAAEWEERGIRVHALCPGSVSSEFALVASGGARKEVLHGFSAQKTVERALSAACRGSWISVPRFKWQLNRIAGRLAGEKQSARFAWRHLRRPHAGEDPGQGPSPATPNHTIQGAD